MIPDSYLWIALVIVAFLIIYFKWLKGGWLPEDEEVKTANNNEETLCYIPQR